MGVGVGSFLRFDVMVNVWVVLVGLGWRVYGMGWYGGVEGP